MRKVLSPPAHRKRHRPAFLKVDQAEPVWPDVNRCCRSNVEMPDRVDPPD